MVVGFRSCLKDRLTLTTSDASKAKLVVSQTGNPLLPAEFSSSTAAACRRAPEDDAMPKDSRIEAFERDDIEARMRERIRSVIEALADEETGCHLVRRQAEGGKNRRRRQ
jgi:hypothetical protein